MENAFYNKENLNPQMKNQDEGSSTITVPDGVDAELLMKVLGIRRWQHCLHHWQRQ